MKRAMSGRHWWEPTLRFPPNLGRDDHVSGPGPAGDMLHIAEHNLKRFFAEPMGPVAVECSPSYAQGPSVSELLSLEPGAQERLLDLSLGHYTEDLGAGTGGLASAIASLYRGISPADVLVLSGVDAAIMDTLSALIAPGMNVLMQTPEYPPLRNVTAWRGARITSWLPSYGEGDDPPADEDDPCICWWNVVDREYTGADVVIATIPHSPFGWTPDAEWLQALVQRTDQEQQVLIVDEVYRGIDLTTDGSGVLPSACELSPRAVVVGGVAKTYGLTGLRIGWVICRDPVLRGRIETHALNGNTNVCAPTELLGMIALKHTKTIHEKNSAIARRNVDAVAAFVKRLDGLFHWVRPTAGLIAWLDWHGPGSAAALAKSVLETERILVADHTLFGWQTGSAGRCEDGQMLQGGLRLGLGPQDMPERLAALEAAVRRYVKEHDVDDSSRGKKRPREGVTPCNS